MERLLEKVKCRVIAVDNGTDAMRYAMGAVTCKYTLGQPIIDSANCSQSTSY